MAAKTCWPTEAGLTNARRQSRDKLAFLVASWKFRANIHRDSLQMDGEQHKSVT